MRMKSLVVGLVSGLASLTLIGAAPVQDQRIDLEMSAQPGERLELDLQSVTGDIDIIGIDGTTARIVGTVSARDWRDDSELIIDDNSSGIRVYSEYLESRNSGEGRRRLRADLTIEVPRRFDVELTGAMDTRIRDIEGDVQISIGNADVEASGLRGEVNLRVANGHINVDDSDVEGRLSNTNGNLNFRNGSYAGRISSTNGSARFGDISGDLDIDATNGGITATSVAGSVTGETTNGNVSVGEVSGNINVETVNGSVAATLVGDGDGGTRVDIETLNGNVEIGAPNDLSATFRIEVRQSEPGRGRDRPEIRSDFPLDIGTGAVRNNEYRQEASGTAGGGDQRIEIRATNGDVELRRGR